MSHTNSYENYSLTIIVNKKLKHSYISIDKNRNLIVKTPYESKKFVDSLLKEKSSWIQKQFLKMEKISHLPQTLLHSEEYLKDRVAYYAQEMQLEFKELKLKRLKSRWGSCSSSRVITLNSELRKLRSALVDYVVVHELSHLVHMNHSKAFHALVEKYLTDSKALRKELQNIRIS